MIQAIDPLGGPFTFSPDGEQLVTYSERALYLWDTVTARQIYTFSTKYRPAQIMVDPFGRYVVASDQTSSLDIWSLDSGTHVTELRIDNMSLFDIDSTGEWIRLSTKDGGWLMRVDSLDLLTVGCSVVRRGMDIQAWEDYISGLPFRQTCEE